MCTVSTLYLVTGKAFRLHHNLLVVPLFPFFQPCFLSLDIFVYVLIDSMTTPIVGGAISGNVRDLSKLDEPSLSSCRTSKTVIP
jgi:hypothetical protein